MFTIREADRPFFMKALEKMNDCYSEEWKCPTSHLEKANYHTNLACQDVHSTRAAFTYASSLLATGDEEDRKRAEDVLWHVAALQDKDPSSASYGIWSWYMEEPLDKMNPPDWNWADFCGKEILQVLEYHGDHISHALYEYLEDTIRNACLSIYRRNVVANYTNIAIMGSYVTLHSAQLLKWPWLALYAKNRFRRFVEYTRRNHTFAEYNSATYTVVAIEDLTRIVSIVKDPEVVTLAEEMLDLAWKTVAEHFHAPTNQWCGPSARSYSFLTTTGTLSFLEQSLQHEVELTKLGIKPEFTHSNANEIKTENLFTYDVAWAYIPLNCPEKYRNAFRKCVPHDSVIGLTAGPYIHAPDQIVATCHMEEDYCLSSWSVTSTWNQRRNLTAYWGGLETRFVNATLLHNLYDFSSGMFTTAQVGGHALCAADMMCDGGDTHCNLDMIRNETIRAYDLRIRFELGGFGNLKWELNGNHAVARDGERIIRVDLLGGSADGCPVAFTLTDSDEDRKIMDALPDLHRRFVGDEKRSYLDVILYSGEEKDICLSALRDTWAAFWFSMDEIPYTDVSISTEDGQVKASVRADGHTLSVQAPSACIPLKHWKGIPAIDGVSCNVRCDLPE